MKTKNIIFILLFIVIAIGGGFFFIKNQTAPVVHEMKEDLYYCPMHPQYTSDGPGICPVCSMKLVKKEHSPHSTSVDTTATDTRATAKKKVLYWTDPMMPGYKAEKPGKSPMGMDLVPIYEESQKGSSLESVPGYAPVSIDTPYQQLIGIKTTRVNKKTLVKTLHAYGYVAHDLELYNAQLEYIDAWHVYYSYLSRRSIKDEYRQDWRQYYMNAPTQNRWRSHEKLDAQKRLLTAEYELRHMGLNDAQLEQLREIKYGQPWIQPDLLFFEKNSRFWIYAQIPESDLGFIDVGQKAIVTIPVYKETVAGVVRNVAQFIDPNTRTTQVRIELPSYRGELMVNMYTNVEFPVELDDALVIPRQAIMDTGLNKVVFVVTQPGIFEPRTITTGFEGNGMVAVKSGLKAGEVIVSAGNFLLDSESRLQGSLMGGQ